MHKEQQQIITRFKQGRDFNEIKGDLTRFKGD